MRVNSEGVFNHQITNHTAQTKEIIAQVPDGGGIKDLPEELYKVRNYNNAFRRMNSKLLVTLLIVDIEIIFIMKTEYLR